MSREFPLWKCNDTCNVFVTHAAYNCRPLAHATVRATRWTPERLSSSYHYREGLNVRNTLVAAAVATALGLASMNASAAAAILLYEAVRQRRG